MFVKINLSVMLLFNCVLQYQCTKHTFINTKITLVSQLLRTKNSLFIESSNNLKDYVYGVVDSIYVTNQEIPTLKKDSIRDLSNIEVLCLSSNKILTIERGALRNLGLIGALNLTDNLLEEIEEGTLNEIDVRHLMLARNRIHRIEDRALHNLHYLESIDLSYNRLRKWNPKWFKGTPVRTINFAHNLLTEIPDYAFTFLDLIDLPDSKRVFYNLIFSYNQLTTVSRDALPRLARLGDFDLSHNFLVTLYKGIFDSVGQIGRLNLSFNRIMFLNKDIFRHTKVHFINLKNNLLTAVDVYMAPVINLDENVLDFVHQNRWDHWKRVNTSLYIEANIL